MSKQRVDDGENHVIIAERNGRDGKLTIDEQPVITGSSGGTMKHLNGNGNIYIGMNIERFVHIFMYVVICCKISNTKS